MTDRTKPPTPVSCICRTKLGPIYLERTARGLSRVGLPASARTRASARQKEASAEDSLLRKAADLIRRYGEGEAVTFDLPLDLEGVSPCLREMLTAARRIPYGQTRTYGWLASHTGRPRAARAAGQAMARNPLPLVIPCHRVIGADGSLVGFGGGLSLKRRLLELERSTLEGRRT